ncbi:MAG TPA: hypothetical protein VGI19_02720 [Candidatus Cybelea sp.]
MPFSVDDLHSAEQTVRGAQKIRTELERNLILAGGFEKDAVDRVMADHGESLSVDGDKVSGVEVAVDSYRRKNPDGFTKLGRLASNEKLPKMQRYVEAYKDVLKARERGTSVRRANERAIARLRPQKPSK